MSNQYTVEITLYDAKYKLDWDKGQVVGDRELLEMQCSMF